MANALKGKTSACLVFVTPNESATEALRVFIEGHMEYMRAKSHETGSLKLIHYSFLKVPNGQIIQDGTLVKLPAQRRDEFFIYSKSMKI